MSRDEVSELLEVPFNTLAVWRHNGFIGHPTVKGATAKPSRYSADDVFALITFKRAYESSGMRQAEAATATRYLDHRPGTVEALWNYWPRPVRLTIYPTHDLAAFNEPTRLLLDKAQRAVRNLREYRERRLSEMEERGLAALSRVQHEIYEHYPADALFADVLHPYVAISPWAMAAGQIREEESRGDPSLRRTNVRALWVTTVFRNAKNVQYRNIPRYQVHHGGLDYADLGELSTEDLLTAEAWALKWIDDALLYYGLNGPPGSVASAHYEVDLSDGLDLVIDAFGEPATKPRELLPIPEIGPFLG